MVSTILANLEGCQERVLAGRLRIYFRDKLSLHQIAKRTGLSRNTIRKWVRAPEATQPAYQCCATFNKLSPFHETLEQALKASTELKWLP